MTSLKKVRVCPECWQSKGKRVLIYRGPHSFVIEQRGRSARDPYCSGEIESLNKVGK